MLWEQRIGAWWHYSIWINGAIITMKHRNRRRRSAAKIETGPRDIGVWYMGKKEFYEGECKGNKWSVPINRVLDLSRQ